MQTIASRWAAIALWPLTIWLSIRNFAAHAADDYVERTSPILAIAAGFWLVVAFVAWTWFANGPRRVFEVLLFFLPVIYVVGAWMTMDREDNFPSA